MRPEQYHNLSSLTFGKQVANVISSKIAEKISKWWKIWLDYIKEVRVQYSEHHNKCMHENAIVSSEDDLSTNFHTKVLFFAGYVTSFLSTSEFQSEDQSEDKNNYARVN